MRFRLELVEWHTAQMSKHSTQGFGTLLAKGMQDVNIDSSTKNFNKHNAKGSTRLLGFGAKDPGPKKLETGLKTISAGFPI